MATETITLPVEVRAVDEPQRLATMIVCRYGETSRRLPRPERFTPGAFGKSVRARSDRVPFTTAHTGGSGSLDTATIVARPIGWDDDGAELRARLRFFETPHAWEAFCRARDGELNGGSVGFRPVAERTGDDGAREITEAQLHHVMLLDRSEATPAYDEPRLVEVRHSTIDVAALLAVSWDHIDPDGCVSMEQLADIGRL